MRARPASPVRFTPSTPFHPAGTIAVAVPPRILRFAHRGASARAPENTLPAFEEAIRLGVDYIECDVRLSADGAALVIHDATVDRTTDGHGAVAALSTGAIRRLDAGLWFAPRFRGTRVPTLEEALEATRGRCGLNIEIKDDNGRSRLLPGSSQGPPPAALIDAVQRAITRCGSPANIILSSFSRRTLLRAHAAMPRCAAGALYSRSVPRLRPLLDRVRLSSIHLHARLATSARLRSVHRLGLPVYVWPAEDPDEMRRLAGIGVDGIMTNDPRLFRVLRTGPPRRKGRRGPS